MHKMRRFHPNESVFIGPAIWTPSAIFLATSTGLQVSAAKLNLAVHLIGQPTPFDRIHSANDLDGE